MTFQPWANKYPPQRVPDVVEFLEKLGVRFSIDFDDEVCIEWPDGLEINRLQRSVVEFKHAIRNRLLNRAAGQRRQFVGGPLNGKRHGFYGVKAIAMNVSKANWASYRLTKDGRAFFVGMSTSEKKAKAMALNLNPAGWQK